MQFTTVLLVVGALVGVCYAGIPFKACLSGASIDVTEVKVYNSSWSCTQEPCPILKGKDVNITIEFKNTGSANITSMTNKVYGVVAGVSLPFPGYPSNMEKVCDLGISGGQCPIGVGASFTEEVKLPVTSVAPSISVIAKWEFETTSEVGCFEVYLKIV